MFCENCGQENNGQSRYCVYCGAELRRGKPSFQQLPKGIPGMALSVGQKRYSLGRASKRVIAVALIACLIITGIAVAVHQSNDVTGRWYFSKNPRFKHSFYLEKDGGVRYGNSEKVVGTWYKKGDYVTVDGTPLQIRKIKGRKMLVWGDESDREDMEIYCRKDDCQAADDYYHGK